MSIQSDINQLLTLGAVGGGIVMSSPTVKLRTKLRQIGRAVKKEVYSDPEILSVEDLRAAPAFQEAIKEGAPLTRELAQLEPTSENIQRARTYQKELERINENAARKAKAEQLAYEEQVAAIKGRTAQETALAERTAFLKQLDTLRAEGKISKKQYNKLTYETKKGDNE